MSEKDNRKPRVISQEASEVMQRLAKMPQTSTAHSDALSESMQLLDRCGASEASVRRAVRDCVITRAVAILQSAMRMLVRDVVNFNEIQGKPLPAFEQKFSLENVREIIKLEVTLGDFVAHAATMHSPEQIEAIYKTVCHETLLTATKLRNDWDGTPEVEIVRAHTAVMLGLQILFNNRNVVCHELVQHNEITDVVFPDVDSLSLYCARMVLGTIEQARVRLTTLDLAPEQSEFGVIPS